MALEKTHNTLQTAQINGTQVTNRQTTEYACIKSETEHYEGKTKLKKKNDRNFPYEIFAYKEIGGIWLLPQWLVYKL